MSHPVSDAEVAPEDGAVEGEEMFDRIVVVDWSANARPKRGADSIWVAWFDDLAESGRSTNVATRSDAVDLLEELVADAPGSARTLLTVDFSLGLPAGSAAEFAAATPDWRGIWDLLAELVVDEADNDNNRFEVAGELNRRAAERPLVHGAAHGAVHGAADGARRRVEGPFWGCPRTRPTPNLTPTKVAPDPLGEWRVVEALLRSDGHRPFSCWQLLGAGAVGSQTLLGIAALDRLCRRLRERSGSPLAVEVWPFTTGLRQPSAVPHSVVVAEVWPSMIDVADDGRIRDEAQVLTLGAWLRRLDLRGDLAGVFEPAIDPAIDPAVVEVVQREEGWVLGAGTWLSTERFCGAPGVPPAGGASPRGR